MTVTPGVLLPHALSAAVTSTNNSAEIIRHAFRCNNKFMDASLRHQNHFRISSLLGKGALLFLMGGCFLFYTGHFTVILQRGVLFNRN
jgi:hypothetical protein